MRGAAIGILGILVMMVVFGLMVEAVGGYAMGMGLLLMAAGGWWVRYSAKRWR